MAHEKDMYIGTRARMSWVPAPNISGYDNSPVGWTSKQEFLNGGVRIRRSMTTHREFAFTWNLMTRENARKITELYSGTRGAGPIYFLDPFAMNQNLVPEHWSAPSMGAYDAPRLIKGSKPTVSPSPVSTLEYPVETAAYQATGEKRKLFIPVPPGYTLWAGVHGPATGGSISAAPVLTPTNVAPPVTLPKLSVSDNNRFSNSFDGSTYIGVEFTVQDNATYTGFMVQVLATGAVPPTGGFILGQGHSGSDFQSPPALEPYSAALGLVGLSVELAEVNDWL